MRNNEEAGLSKRGGRDNETQQGQAQMKTGFTSVPDSLRPRGPTGPCHAYCCFSPVAVTPQHAWAPPVDFGDGLAPEPGRHKQA